MRSVATAIGLIIGSVVVSTTTASTFAPNGRVQRADVTPPETWPALVSEVPSDPTATASRSASAGAPASTSPVPTPSAGATAAPTTARLSATPAPIEPSAADLLAGALGDLTRSGMTFRSVSETSFAVTQLNSGASTTTYNAESDIQMPDRSRTRLHQTFAEASMAQSFDMDLIVVGDRSYTRLPNTSEFYVAETTTPGVNSGFPRGRDARDVERVSIDGREVRRISYTPDSPPSLFAAATNSVATTWTSTADAWIRVEDGQLIRLVLTSSFTARTAGVHGGSVEIKLGPGLTRVGSGSSEDGKPLLSLEVRADYAIRDHATVFAIPITAPSAVPWPLRPSSPSTPLPLHTAPPVVVGISQP
jgi:hypothetical protein